MDRLKKITPCASVRNVTLEPTAPQKNWAVRLFRHLPKEAPTPASSEPPRRADRPQRAPTGRCADEGDCHWKMGRARRTLPKWMILKSDCLLTANLRASPSGIGKCCLMA